MPSIRSSWCSTSRRCSPPARNSPRCRRTRSTSRARSTCSNSRSTKPNRTATRSSSCIRRRSRSTGCRASTKRSASGASARTLYTHPTTMYGCNKLYCEQLGHYYSRFYKQLAAESASGRVDFRCVRFPGLISAVTMPSGGTSDYAPEMIHAAAKGEPYEAFVRPDARIPFMAMPDGVDALLQLAAAPRGALTRTAYNVAAFSPTAEDVRRVVVRAFPDADDLMAGRREASGHHRHLARRRRRQRRPARLGLRPALRLRRGVRGVSDSDDSASSTPGRRPLARPSSPSGSTPAAG